MRFRCGEHHVGSRRYAGQLRRRDARQYLGHSDLHALSDVAVEALSPRAMLFSSYTFLFQFLPAVLLASIGTNFSLGLLMENPLRRRSVGMLGVTLNLALLCYFKYTNFIFDSISALSGAPLPFVN